jgi:pyrimidine-nucleoside phosphorylase
MNIIDIITKKRNNKPLKNKEIQYIIDKLLKEEVALYQVSALLMAIFLNGLTDIELQQLTISIRDSGKNIKFRKIDKPVIDKHSTGGVGDKISFIIGPICASCGLAIPLSAGRSLGHTGGTIDKLESIPDIRTTLDISKIEHILEKCGLAIFAQSDEIAPADKILYSLRDATATVESIPLIVSSILGKKLAFDTDGIIFDVKFGSGAFIQEIAKAKTLAQELVDISRTLNRNANAVLTSNNEPLGRFVGNSLELYETIKILNGEENPEDIIEVSKTISKTMLYIGGIVGDINEGEVYFNKSIRSGKPLEILEKMIDEMGGDTSYIENPELLRESTDITPFYAPAKGIITKINAKKTGEFVRELGGGRFEMDDIIDHSVGVEFIKKCGASVDRGEEIALIYHKEDYNSEKIIQSFSEIITINDEKYFKEDIIVSRYTGDDIWLNE